MTKDDLQHVLDILEQCKMEQDDMDYTYGFNHGVDDCITRVKRWIHPDDEDAFDSAEVEKKDKINFSQKSVKRALDVFKDLAKKEIAEKPEVKADDYYDDCLVYDTWVCPRCGEEYEIGIDDFEYCPICGQHVDLSGLE